MIMSQETSTPAIVAPQVLLNNHLMALKLPTFAREYDMLHPKMIGNPHSILLAVEML